MSCWLLPWPLNSKLRTEKSSNRALGRAFASGRQTYPSLTGTETGVAAAVVKALICGFPADVVGLRETTVQTGTSRRALETVPDAGDAGVRQL